MADGSHLWCARKHGSIVLHAQPSINSFLAGLVCVKPWLILCKAHDRPAAHASNPFVMACCPQGHPLHEQAKKILADNNPNANKNSPEGLVGEARRFVSGAGAGRA